MRKFILSALPAAVLLIAGAAHADEMDMIKARQAYFKSLGGSMKAMAPLTKSFDAATAAAEAEKFKTALAVDVAPNFAPGTSVDDFPGDTKALAKIWENMDDFGAKAEALHTAAGELIAAAEAGDGKAFAAAYGKTGGTCKACHDAYRMVD